MNDEQKIIAYLNRQANRNYRPVKVNIKFIQDRMKEGYELQDFFDVIDCKVKEWQGTTMAKYLRPATLFNNTKFNQYVGETGEYEADTTSKDKPVKKNYNKGPSKYYELSIKRAKQRMSKIH